MPKARATHGNHFPLRRAPAGLSRSPVDPVDLPLYIAAPSQVLSGTLNDAQITASPGPVFDLAQASAVTQRRSAAEDERLDTHPYRYVSSRAIRDRLPESSRVSADRARPSEVDPEPQIDERGLTALYDRAVRGRIAESGYIGAEHPGIALGYVVLTRNP